MKSNSINGLILIDKPAGWTSHDVTNKIRHLINVKKVGHTGTLDPMATGLMVVLIGKATKLAKLFEGDDKQYLAQATIGQTTDTQDSQGKIIQTRKANDLPKELIEKVFRSFEGQIGQIPPMFSALKVNGKKLYELARKGKEIKREPRLISIYNIKIYNIALDDFPKVDFLVDCSKGTYIRTLCHDVGQKLGYGAHLSSLRRTKCGRFDIKRAVKLDEIINDPGLIEKMLISIDILATKVNNYE